METFRPQGQQAKQGEVQLQQEHIQYVDNDCCQVAIQPSTAAMQQDHLVDSVQQQQPLQQQSHTLPHQPMATATLKRSKVGKPSASTYNTLERNMAEVAEQNRRSERQLASAAATLERRYGGGGAAAAAGSSGVNNSCDTCDAPLTPASLAGIDHRDLEHRPLTRSVTRATMFDEPPEK